MINTLSFHNVHATDAEWLSELHALSFDAAHAWNAETVQQSLMQPNVIGHCCSMEQQPAGFILLSQAANEAEILTLAVAPTFQRRGIAKNLIAYAANDLQKMNVSELFLEVAVTNQPALALYEALGFSQKGIRKKYYSNGNDFIDAIIMRRALPLT